MLICLPTIFITDNSLSRFSISSDVASSKIKNLDIDEGVVFVNEIFSALKTITDFVGTLLMRESLFKLLSILNTNTPDFHRLISRKSFLKQVFSTARIEERIDLCFSLQSDW